VSGVAIRPLKDLAAMRRLGVACGLEDGGRDDETILAAWGAYDDDRLVGAVALEKFGELDIVSWLAVDAAYRCRGVGAALCAALEHEAIRRGTPGIWATARAPAFFLARGYENVTAGPERDALLGGCLDCSQYGRGCEPQALTKRLEGLGHSAW
jgi:N-acetylglutamate synthase-like GNAT family acetyltransferase